MPTLTHDISASAGRVKTSGYLPVDGKRILACSAFNLDGSEEPNDCWVELGVTAGGDNPNNRLLVLDQNYIGVGSLVGWTGLIVGEPEMYIYASCFATSASTIRLAVLFEKT